MIRSELRQRLLSLEEQTGALKRVPAGRPCKGFPSLGISFGVYSKPTSPFHFHPELRPIPRRVLRRKDAPVADFAFLPDERLNSVDAQFLGLISGARLRLFSHTFVNDRYVESNSLLDGEWL